MAKFALRIAALIAIALLAGNLIEARRMADSLSNLGVFDRQIVHSNGQARSAPRKRSGGITGTEMFKPLAEFDGQFVDADITDPVKVIAMLNTLMHDIAWAIYMDFRRKNASWITNHPDENELADMRTQFERTSLHDAEFILNLRPGYEAHTRGQ